MKKWKQWLKYFRGTSEELREYLVTKIIHKKYNFTVYWKTALEHGNMVSLSKKRKFNCKFQKQYRRLQKYIL